MESSSVKAGVIKSLFMVAGFCIAIAVFIALIEEVALLLAFYFA